MITEANEILEELDCMENIDIKGHLSVMRDYAANCEHVTEFGVRDVVSTWSWLSAGVNKIVAYDIYTPTHPRWQQFLNMCESNDVDFNFILGNTLEIPIIEKTDLLFVDTIHTFGQVHGELTRHAMNVEKYLVFHDTHAPVHRAGSGIEVSSAIKSYMNENPGIWKLSYESKESNGLAVYERVSS
tara:strand:+ start:1262 stop:1816 length:555 start_codon:yes stop_codon:yes gene_type:complete